MRNGTAHRRRGPKTALARAIRSCHADSFWPRSLQGPFSFQIPTGHGIEILGRVVAAKELHPDDGEDVDDSQMIVAILYPPSSWRPTGSRCSPSNWNSFARCSCWCKCDAWRPPSWGSWTPWTSRIEGAGRLEEDAAVAVLVVVALRLTLQFQLDAILVRLRPGIGFSFRLIPFYVERALFLMMYD